VSQDRLHEKALFSALRIPIAGHAAVDRREDLIEAVHRLGLPGILKTRRMGYDGKGQCLVRRAADLDDAWTRLGGAGSILGGAGLIYEKFQPFSRELSIIGVRSAAGAIAYYPLCANTHVGGVLRYTVAPYTDKTLERMARRYLKRVLEHLTYIGVLTIEFFVVGGSLVANEMAPRVHNSGHWTIEGCVTSQFENHLRAICDLPLGGTRPLGHAAMINFLGEMPDRERLLAVDGLAYHDYGKQPRTGRKLGHCTIVTAGARERDRVLARALRFIRCA
jgi:5-(carboxyamino)imidazole ribonucleotide synthase